MANAKTKPEETPQPVVSPDMEIDDAKAEELAREMILAEQQAYGRRRAELDAGFNDVMTGDELPLDTQGLIIETGRWFVYEQPYLCPEDKKTVLTMQLFTPLEYTKVMGDWAIRWMTPHGNMSPAGKFLWIVVRGTAYDVKLTRNTWVAQLMMTPQLGLLGADVRKQLAMLSQKDIRKSLDAVEGLKEIEIFQDARNWKRVAVGNQASLDTKYESHLDSAQDMYAKSTKAKSMGATGFAKSLIENVDWKKTFKQIIILLILSGGVAYMGRVYGWW